MNGANSKNLLKMKTQLRSKDTSVLLQHPVLVRPGYFYTISIEPFPDDHIFYSVELKTEEQLEPDITIKFPKFSISQMNKKVFGLISALDFNRI